MHSIKEALAFAKMKTGYEDVREHLTETERVNEAYVSVLQGRFSSSPTGSGKRLIFEVAPYISTTTSKMEKEKSV